MIVCRTKKTRKLGKSFLIAKPLMVIGFSASIILLTILATTGFMIYRDSISESMFSLLFLIFVGIMILTLFISVKKSEEKFHAFVINDDGIIYVLDLGNVFMYSKAFGKVSINGTPIHIFFDWFKGAKRMNSINNDDSFDKFLTSSIVINKAHYIEKLYEVSENDRYIKVKIRMKRNNPIKGELLTESDKTFKIPQDFENVDYLANQLKLMM